MSLPGTGTNIFLHSKMPHLKNREIFPGQWLFIFETDCYIIIFVIYLLIWRQGLAMYFG